jgi:hypothetical protein
MAGGVCRGGKVCTVGLVVALAAVPDAGARRIPTSARPGCYASCCGPVPTPNTPGDLISADASSRDWFGLTVRESAGGEGRHHRRVRDTRPAVVSSGTAVPSSRGRPPEQPQNSVVNPTQPPPQGEGDDANRGNTGEPTTEASAGRPEPRTARPPAGSDQVEPDGNRPRSELKVVHGCPDNHERPIQRIMTAKIASIVCPWLPPQP